jgi:hypothetical protein
MPRPRSPRPSVNVLLDAYTQAHKELEADLDRLLLEVPTSDLSAQYLTDRMRLVEYHIARLRSGYDPETGDPYKVGPIDPETGVPYWQGMIGDAGQNGLAAELGQASYSAGVRIADAVMEGQGFIPPAADFANIHDQAATLIADELTQLTDDNLQRILSVHQGAYRDIQAKTTIAAMTKGEDIRSLAGRMVRDIRAQKLDPFVDAGGRTWSTDAYTRMLARTVATKAARQADENRAAEAGIDLVLITGGIGGASCEVCIEALGQIYSRSGTSEEYPALQDIIDRGFEHPNCGHTASPYIEDSPITDEEIRAIVDEVSEEIDADDLLVEGEGKAEAVKGAPVVTSSDDDLDWADKRKAWLDGLGEDQSYALEQWTQNEFGAIRMGEAEGVSATDDPQYYRKLVDDFHDAVDDAPAYRGLVRRGLADLDEPTLQRFLGGEGIAEFEATSSCTKLGTDVAMKWAESEPGLSGIVLEIESSSGIDITPLNSGEQEVLLGRGSRFERSGEPTLLDEEKRIWLLRLRQTK